MKYSEMEALAVLEEIMPEVADRLRIELYDPGSELGAGSMAKTAVALETISKILMGHAKELVSPQIYGGLGEAGKVDYEGVRFTWVPPTETTRIDTRAIRKDFPKEDNPQYYAVSNRSDYIKLG